MEFPQIQMHDDLLSREIETHMLVSKQIYVNLWKIRLDQNSIMHSGGEGIMSNQIHLTLARERQ